MTEKLSKVHSFTGTSADLRNVLSSRLSHRELRSSLRESHSFLSLPAGTIISRYWQKLTNLMGNLGCAREYEVVSKIFRTGAAIYTAVVVARSTGPKRPNCEFWVLLRLLRRLRGNVRRRRPELWREQTWLFHHDNAPSHNSVLTQQFLAKH
jgi:hypothetical protein